MTVLHIDYEVYSECDLKDAGVFRYAEHPSTEIMACTYKFDNDSPLMLWIPYDNVPRQIIEEVKKRRPNVSVIAKSSCPQPVFNHIKQGGEVSAHNAQYE